MINKFWLVLYPSWYCLLGTEGWIFLLTEQNPLSMMKVICRQSFKT